MKRNVVIISGGFDPIHTGHLEYIKRAAALKGRRGLLIAIVNNDDFLLRKKGYKMLDQDTRAEIVESIKGVDLAIVSASRDDTVEYDLWRICELQEKRDRLIFAKGGDRFKNEIPEAKLCERFGIEIVDGLGPKRDSSSKIAQSFLDAMEQPAELRRMKYGPLDRVDQEKLSNQEEPQE